MARDTVLAIALGPNNDDPPIGSSYLAGKSTHEIPFFALKALRQFDPNVRRNPWLEAVECRKNTESDSSTLYLAGVREDVKLEAWCSLVIPDWICLAGVRGPQANRQNRQAKPFLHRLPT
jgi:hypothetical protein